MGKKVGECTRRDFLKGTAGAAAAITIVPGYVLGEGESPPSDRLNIACIGVGGRGEANWDAVKRESIVALCDADTRRARKAFQTFPNVKRYQDFRRMFDEMEKQIDAVVVSTPDHTHAVACMAAIRRGKHVYCEKPLAHSIHEVRALRKAAREHRVITQLGNQGHSSEDIRRLCEWIWDGAIGNVREVHAFSGVVLSYISRLDRLSEKHEIPEGLDWDVWLGPAKYRPYHRMYLPGSWRGWSPFGTGAIGDWVCHVVDPAFWALHLDSPTSVQVEAEGYDPEKHADTFPRGTRRRFEFPAHGDRGPVTLLWFDGVEKPPRPEELEPGKELPSIGAVIIGDKGKIMHGSHGAGGLRIIPEEKMAAYKQPERTLSRVRGHHQDWLDSVKSGRQAGSNFDYGGPLTELALLGNIGVRMLGRKLEWNGEETRFTNCPEANTLVNPPYRKGWTL